MTPQERQQTRWKDYGLLLALGLVFLVIGIGQPGFWEPWESALVQVAQHAQAENSDQTFWVPQTAYHTVDRPWAQVWSLMAILGLGGSSEAALRLPGALVALGLVGMVLHVMRRQTSRLGAWAVVAVLLSLPVFAFGARLLVGGIWQMAAVAVPVLLYVLGLTEQTPKKRQLYGVLLGLSAFVSLLCGGLWGVGLALAIIATHALMGKGRWRGFLSAGAGVGFLIAAALSSVVITKYAEHVGASVNRPQVLSIAALEQAIKGGKITQLGQDALGGIVGTSRENAEGEHFVVSPDPQWQAAPMWSLWLRHPQTMSRLMETISHCRLMPDGSIKYFAPIPSRPPIGEDIKALLTSEGALPRVVFPVSDQGSDYATLQFLTYHIFDSSVLEDGRQAEVLSIVGAQSALGVVWPSLEAAQGGVVPEGQEVAHLKGGQAVTVIQQHGDWTEIEYQKGRVGFISAEALRVKDALVHRTFESWIRWLFYGLFPWVLVLPFAVGSSLVWGGRSVQTTPEQANQKSMADLSLVWLAFSVASLGLGGSLWGQSVFTGALPVALVCGLWLSDKPTWEAMSMQQAPMVRKLLGFAALCLLVILLHDYYKNPWLFVTGYLQESKPQWDEKLRVMEGPYRNLRFVFAVVLVSSFMGAFGWGERVLSLIGGALGERFAWMRRGWDGLVKTRAGAVGGAAWGALRVVARPRLILPTLALVFAGMNAFAYLPDITHHLTQKGLLDTYLAAALPKEPLYNVQQLTSKTCERTSECALGQTCVASQCVEEGIGFYLSDFKQLTQSSITEAFKFEQALELLPFTQNRLDDLQAKLNAAPSAQKTNLKRDLDFTQKQLAKLNAQLTKTPPSDQNPAGAPLRAPSRIFAVTPRKMLSQINAQFRLPFVDSGVPSEDRRNLAILDNRSSQYVLLSNMLREGEVDQNPLNKLILKGKPSPQFPMERPVKFENGLEFLGYDVMMQTDLERHLESALPPGNPPVGVGGKKLVVIYYFYVGADPRAGKPSDGFARLMGEDWQMFLHIDEGGNRINGDHYPGDGDFHTDTWVIGDYVRDIHTLEVDSGSSAGMYTMWFGFFKGDSRLKVTEGEHQDNRVRMGTIRIQGGL